MKLPPRDPHEPQERVSRFRSDPGDEAWLAALNEGLANIELPSPSRAAVDATQLPLVYIVGAPRSGTTLLSQVLSRYLQVGYIDNLMARFWQRPSVGIHLSRLVLGEERRLAIAFESEHGATRGAAGPHEFGYFWRHWLQLDAQRTHHLDDAAIAALDLKGLGAVLEGEILASFGMPTVFKNVICGFHADALTRSHPRSLFVHITRDERATCASILGSRLKRFGSYSAWWSLKPSTYPEIAGLETPSLQVVQQVRDSRHEMAAELGRPGIRSLTLSYEELCLSPGTVVHAVAEALAGMGSSVEILEGIPPSFTLSAGPPLPDPVDHELRAALSGRKRMT